MQYVFQYVPYYKKSTGECQNNARHKAAVDESVQDTVMRLQKKKKKKRIPPMNFHWGRVVQCIIHQLQILQPYSHTESEQQRVKARFTTKMMFWEVPTWCGVLGPFRGNSLVLHDKTISFNSDRPMNKITFTTWSKCRGLLAWNLSAPKKKKKGGGGGCKIQKQRLHFDSIQTVTYYRTQHQAQIRVQKVVLHFWYWYHRKILFLPKASI